MTAHSVPLHSRLVMVQLDRRGNLTDRPGHAVADPDVFDFLTRRLAVDRDITDIFLFVHGWMVPTQRAYAAGKRLLALLEQTYIDDPQRYPALSGFSPLLVGVQWPSLGPYNKIRDRAHLMSTGGRAADIIAAILGTLDHLRERPPETGRRRLRTRSGQYLHCVGHSFGCRFIGEGIIQAGWPRRARRLGWPWSSAHRFNVDSFVALQMAAPPKVLRKDFAPIFNGSAPIRGPVALTHSRYDWANRVWHSLAERSPAVGAIGSPWPANASSVRLRPLSQAYTYGDFRTRLTNVDAGWLYNARNIPVGAHSDFWYPETAHLVLSLADLSR